NQLVKLSRILIPRREPKIKKDDLEKTMRLLDQRFIERPAVAVEQAYTVTNKMLETAEAALNIAIDLLYDYEREEYDQVVMLENQVDQYEDALVEYNMKISAKVLNKADNQKLNIMMHILNDIERISDHAINIADQAKLKASSRIPFSDEAMEELKLYTDIVREIVSRTKTALAELDLEVALEIRPLEDLIDEVNKLLSDAHINRLKNGICEVENGIIIMEIYNCLERIGDHCLNVAISLIQFSEQHFRQHDFGDRHDKSDPRYQEMYDYYRNKYTLPQTVSNT
ncbi:MAG: Na/Pi cotransporter family protein, partial [Clostridiaceae bacterium]|nr:Na/Pi cotransporter family protein [Clostridiaceae bacterium]